MTAGLHCSPGDLARLVGFSERSGLNDRFVTLAKERPIMHVGRWAWRLAEPLRIVLPIAAVDSDGRRFKAGEQVTAWICFDEHIRPIRDPGSAAVDEMLQIAGKPIGLLFGMGDD